MANQTDANRADSDSSFPATLLFTWVINNKVLPGFGSRLIPEGLAAAVVRVGKTDHCPPSLAGDPIRLDGDCHPGVHSRGLEREPSGSIPGGFRAFSRTSRPTDLVYTRRKAIAVKPLYPVRLHFFLLSPDKFCRTPESKRALSRWYHNRGHQSGTSSI
jgi:hypothetical protein